MVLIAKHWEQQYHNLWTRVLFCNTCSYICSKFKQIFSNSFCCKTVVHYRTKRVLKLSTFHPLWNGEIWYNKTKNPGPTIQGSLCFHGNESEWYLKVSGCAVLVCTNALLLSFLSLVVFMHSMVSFHRTTESSITVTIVTFLLDPSLLTNAGNSRLALGINPTFLLVFGKPYLIYYDYF